MGRVTGVVLAGGASSRLGRDKALLRLDGGDPRHLLSRTLDLLGEVCGSALIVGRALPGCACVEDALPGNGPAGGIATALEAVGGPCLILSCDLPFMEAAVLRRLLAARAEQPGAMLCTAYAARETGRVETLVAVYEPSALPFFQACLAGGRLGVGRALPEHRRRLVFYSAGEARPFFNINYPADLEAALAATGKIHAAGGISNGRRGMSAHIDRDGNALMVDISGKGSTERSATAEGSILLTPPILAAVREKTAAKGDVLSVAQLAGIMGAKRTPDLIPLCHPLSLTGCRVTLEIVGQSVRAECTVKTRHRTGVEMEALCGVTTALLTVYDMCKGMDKGMEISGVRLLEKSGGKSGDYARR